MKFYYLLFSLLIVPMIFNGQDTLNRVDPSGKKQGFWRKVDKQGSKIYEGRFKDDTPVGEFKYFYPGGSIKAVSKMFANGKRAHTVTYFQNGKKNAEGNYLNQKKDSLWRFYSEVDQALISEEFYRNDKKEGESKNYYPSGGISESTTWKNGVRDGPWTSYFADGKPKVRGNYKNDQKEGPIKCYYYSGKIWITGQYTDGESTGTWIYYSDLGAIKKKVYYQKGMIIKTDSTFKIK